MKHYLHLNFTFLVLLLFASSPALADNKSKFGFGSEATISGFLSPKLKRVKVTNVLPGSPAATAGLTVGDMIVEANGKAIEGSPARQMAAQLRAIKPGQLLRLKIKRVDQTFAIINIVAGPGKS